MQYIIRPAMKSDASAMYSISIRDHAQSYYQRLIPANYLQDFNDRYRMSDIRRREFIKKTAEKIDDPNWFVFVAEANGRVLGYTMAYVENEHTVQLKGLFVDPRWHKQGIGSSLFKASLGVASSDMVTRLLVVSENDIAKKLYEKYGFKPIGQSDKLFFGAKQDIMEKSVTD